MVKPEKFGHFHLVYHFTVPLKCVICFIKSSLKIMKNAFCLKSPFRSQDIQVFVTTFWSRRKSCLLRKIRLTSKFMTSQPGLQTIPIHVLPNISQSKGNQAMKSGQLIEYNKTNIFYAENKAGRLVPDLFLFFEKANKG